MPTWILLAIAAQLLNAVVAIIDKYIVTHDKLLPQPFVYAFYTCVLSGAAVVIYTFDIIPVPIDGVAFPSLGNVRFPTLEVLGLSLLSAYTFFYALVSLFKALQQADTSDVVPVIGAVTAIISYALGYLFLGAQPSPNFFAGMILLTVGTALASHFRFSWRVALMSFSAGLFFAFHFVVIKALFNLTSFDDGFFWSRVGFVMFALSLLLMPAYGKRIYTHTKAAGKRTGAFILVNKVIAGFASILILKATELGDVSVVQALGGLQYVFIFAFGAILGPHTPAAYGENTRSLREIFHKALFMSMIVLGLFMLFR